MAVPGAGADVSGGGEVRIRFASSDAVWPRTVGPWGRLLLAPEGARVSDSAMANARTSEGRIARARTKKRLGENEKGRARERKTGAVGVGKEAE